MAARKVQCPVPSSQSLLETTLPPSPVLSTPYPNPACANNGAASANNPAPSKQQQTKRVGMNLLPGKKKQTEARAVKSPSRQNAPGVSCAHPSPMRYSPPFCDIARMGDKSPK